jgi:hypothetical protein
MPEPIARDIGATNCVVAAEMILIAFSPAPEPVPSYLMGSPKE